MKDIKQCVKISAMLAQDKNKCTNGKCKLHVCTSCRPSGFPRDPATNRPGFKLFQELSSLLDKNLLKYFVDLIKFYSMKKQIFLLIALFGCFLISHAQTSDSPWAVNISANLVSIQDFIKQEILF